MSAWLGFSTTTTSRLAKGALANRAGRILPRDYIGYGFRARAQEVAQERLGDLTRIEAEGRVWKESQAERFTSLNRRLSAAADNEGLVEDGSGAGAWSALLRGRLVMLEELGLAVRVGRRFRLDPGLEFKLRRLQINRDIMRPLNQRRLDGVQDITILPPSVWRGVVAKTGFHDELGLQPFVVIRDTTGAEGYGRLTVGSRLQVGQTIVLEVGTTGIGRLASGRDVSLDL